jgi:hypothetical protein
LAEKSEFFLSINRYSSFARPERLWYSLTVP